MNLLAVAVQVVKTKLSLAVDLLRRPCRAFARYTLKPTNRCVVIARASVSHNVRDVVVRQVDVLRVAAKPKLQDAHARKTKTVAQLDYVRRDHAEVFRNDRQLTQRVANRREQFLSRRFDPLTAFGSLVAAGYFPTRRE